MTHANNVRGPFYLKESIKGEWLVCGYNGKIVRRYPATQFKAAENDVHSLVNNWRAA